jgi:hypothetical protein
MTEILSNVWFWIYVCTLASSIMIILLSFHYNDLFNLKKSMGNLEQSLTEGDEKINQNFEKIHKELSLIEREINQAVNISRDFVHQIESSGSITGGASTPKNNLTFIGDEKLIPTPLSPLYGSKKTKYKKYKKSFKPMNKKYQKFLTPKGRIKKHYRDNPMAQKCYEKFHALKQS